MEKRIFENVMKFLESYGENSITFEWNSYGGDPLGDMEWDYGWSNLGRKKIPNSINNLIIEMVSEKAEPIFENIYCELESYRLTAIFYPKEKKIKLISFVEEYATEDSTAEKIVLADSPTIRFMKENNINLVTCSYDGSGDSGELNNLEINGNHENIYEWERDSQKTVLIDAIYRFLEDSYGGWEIDDGSNGNIELKVDGSLTISHTWNSREWYESGESRIITSEDFD
jgi:hypothetical protein